MKRSLRSIQSAGFRPFILVMLLYASAGVSVSAGSGTSLAPLLAGQSSSNVDIPLNPQHPERYVVKRGDTLWDISAMFLRDPWYWPEIWQINPQVENPHLIYPGDVLVLVYMDGKPRIMLERSAETGGAERLQPQIRSQDLDEAIKTIPFDVIGPFLSKGSVLSREEIDRLPHIMAIRDGHLVAGAGMDLYVRGKVGGVNEGYSVIHIGEPLIDPDDGQMVGYEGIFVGEGVIRSGGDPATLHLVKTQREALVGDRLVDQNFEIPLNFIPRAPETDISGRIIHVIDGMAIIGQYHIVVLNRGANHGLDAGHVMTVWQAGQVVKDRVAGEDVLLPDEIAGTLMIFKAYDRISYALIMEATSEIHILDKVRTPS
jgi:hypothetical protein